MNPKIKVFCFFYNEAALLPFFLNHYRWLGVDCIHAFVSNSTDDTWSILYNAQAETANGGPGIELDPIEFPSGMDDFLKVQALNAAINAPGMEFNDWMMVVDADEFIWPAGLIGYPADVNRSENPLLCCTPEGDPLTVHEYLDSVPSTETVLYARMWNVFRHETDGDLDAGIVPVVTQRRHGIPARTHPENLQYQKPIVIRAGCGFRYVPGNHGLLPNSCTRIAYAHSFDGAHWQNADPGFCVTRRIRDRRDRQSEVNRTHGLGSQHHFITDKDVLEVCEAHRQDPVCF